MSDFHYTPDVDDPNRLTLTSYTGDSADIVIPMYPYGNARMLLPLAMPCSSIGGLLPR